MVSLVLLSLARCPATRAAMNVCDERLMLQEAEQGTREKKLSCCWECPEQHAQVARAVGLCQQSTCM